ncbi:MAG: hypothetical protein JWO68_714 [Actinomycetia bacterium]|nr:hypothetical protein [Actinomycetes bacterium]
MNEPEEFTPEEIRANRRQLLLMAIPVLLAALVALVAVLRAVL